MSMIAKTMQHHVVTLRAAPKFKQQFKALQRRRASKSTRDAKTFTKSFLYPMAFTCRKFRILLC